VTFDSYGDVQCRSEPGWMATTTEKLGYMQGTQENMRVKQENTSVKWGNILEKTVMP